MQLVKSNALRSSVLHEFLVTRKAFLQQMPDTRSVVQKLGRHHNRIQISKFLGPERKADIQDVLRSIAPGYTRVGFANWKSETSNIGPCNLFILSAFCGKKWWSTNLIYHTLMDDEQSSMWLWLDLGSMKFWHAEVQRVWFQAPMCCWDHPGHLGLRPRQLANVLQC